MPIFIYKPKNLPPFRKVWFYNRIWWYIILLTTFCYSLTLFILIFFSPAVKIILRLTSANQAEDTKKLLKERQKRYRMRII